jgi:hypothetical protein
MLLSIANGRPRNIESVRTQSLFPENIQSSAANIIAFIQEYYNYINTHGLPSAEISSIITDKDIDVASNDYLDNIRDLIANSIPNSTSLDKVTLYKIIVKYYNTRGSEDSIIAFFKIFLNETVSIFYPKEYLFAPSTGTINWDPYDVLPLVLSAAPVNGVADTITVNDSGFENLMIIGDPGAILTLGDTTALTQDPILTGDNIPITFPALIYAGTYDGRDAYTNDGTLTNLLQKPYALYYDGQYAQWTLRGGVGKTLTITGDLTDDGGAGVVFDALVESGTYEGNPFYTSITDASQRCYYDNYHQRWVVTITQDGDIGFWYGLSNTGGISTPDTVDSWTADIGGGEDLSLLSGGTKTAGYWYSTQITGVNLLLPPTNQGAVWAPKLTSTVGVPFLNFVDGDAAATQPTNGNLFARTGVFPNRVVYKCVDDGSLKGHSIIWQLQSGPEYVYEDSKGFASDIYKIQDSTYWQNYSYDIQSNSDASVWRDAFLKFVHPAGLKLFTSLLLEMQSLNVWDSFISYELTNAQDRNSWLSALNPPYFSDATNIYHQHSPKYQPGWLSVGASEYIFTALFAEGSITLKREVILMLQLILVPLLSERQLVSRDYDLNGIKFRDPSRLGDGFLGSDRTIQLMIDSTLESYPYQLLNVAAVIRQGTDTSKATTELPGIDCTLNITAVSGTGAITALNSAPTDAGTGYAVGDILSINGDDEDNTAFALVTTISGGGAKGPITGVTLIAAGLGYTTGAGKVTGGIVGTNCKLSIAAVDGAGAITSLVARPAVPGSGYTVGDILTISGGTAGNLATATVATLSGSGVATVTLLAAGAGYTKSNDTTQPDLITNYSLI